jgi:hypothetical protein
MTKDVIRKKMQQYQQQIEDAKRRDIERLQFRTQSITNFQELVKNIIKPTMESFSKEMQCDICKFRIDGDFTNSDDPQIRFWATPEGISLNEYDFKDVPHIFYSIDPLHGVVQTNISTIIKGKAGRAYDGASYRLEEVNKEVIERDLVKMVNELMDNILG